MMADARPELQDPLVLIAGVMPKAALKTVQDAIPKDAFVWYDMIEKKDLNNFERLMIYGSAMASAFWRAFRKS